MGRFATLEISWSGVGDHIPGAEARDLPGRNVRAKARTYLRDKSQGKNQNAGANLIIILNIFPSGIYP
jgi:hypothetical protein